MKQYSHEDPPYEPEDPTPTGAAAVWGFGALVVAILTYLIFFM